MKKTEQEKLNDYVSGFDNPKRASAFLDDVLVRHNDEKWVIGGLVSMLDSIADQQSLEQVKTYIAKLQVSLFDWTHEPTIEDKHKNRLTRRAVEANAPVIIPFSKNDIIARYGLNCYLCGELLTEKEATIDHVVPLAQGGWHCAENARIACEKCNTEKGNKTRA
ncbi:MAG TPA: HNH endonuclease [Pyrinomonadaceae bacterium]|jgi:hypothetical protein